jgi:tryptophan 2-C-methyltransferase
MRLALVNTNRMQPPIAPIGLDYLAEALNAAGHQVELLDLCWEKDAHAAIVKFLDSGDFGLIGVTLRNTDDCGFTSRQSFLVEFADLLATIRLHADAPVVLGGVGFSVMPESILDLSNADLGVWG